MSSHKILRYERKYVRRYTLSFKIPHYLLKHAPCGRGIRATCVHFNQLQRNQCVHFTGNGNILIFSNHKDIFVFLHLWNNVCISVICKQPVSNIDTGSLAGIPIPHWKLSDSGTSVLIIHSFRNTWRGPNPTSTELFPSYREITRWPGFHCERGTERRAGGAPNVFLPVNVRQEQGLTSSEATKCWCLTVLWLKQNNSLYNDLCYRVSREKLFWWVSIFASSSLSVTHYSIIGEGLAFE